MFDPILSFIKERYQTTDFIPLHAPTFSGNEKKYLIDTIDSTFVSSVGKYVDRFEKEFAEFVGAKYAVAVVNGTAALHLGLVVAGVQKGMEVLTQPLTFIATCNAISYCDASPVFIDVDKDNLGLCPVALESWLLANAKLKDGKCINTKTGAIIQACVPMHTFGLPAQIDKIIDVCHRYNIKVVEDAAESLGSYFNDQHTGTFGDVGVFSFNGNKIITSGGGGMIVTNNEVIAKQAKHLSTTAKVPHAWEYQHDSIGFNYRMPNLNAALGVAQLEQLPDFLIKKRDLAKQYEAFFATSEIEFITEQTGSTSNYWLNAVRFSSKQVRDDFLAQSNQANVMTRPIWQLMSDTAMYKHCQSSCLTHARKIVDTIVNIPSTPISR